jgi:Protein of unknown function (DUF1059)
MLHPSTRIRLTEGSIFLVTPISEWKGGGKMDTRQLGISQGTWVVANCGKFPSEKHCMLVMMAPIEQKADLVDAAATHAVKSHGHEDNPELREQIGQLFETVQM